MRYFIQTASLALLIAYTTIPAHTQEPSAQADRAGNENPKDATARPQVTAEKPMSVWMEKKLEYSKAILESLTKGDFDKTCQDAEAMRFIGRIEEFVRRRNPDYRVQLQAFDVATRELIRHAGRHNAEGAVSAFNQMTTSCVACHTLLREGVE